MRVWGLCQQCDEETITNFRCKVCKGCPYICQKCYNSHQIIPHLKNHMIQDINSQTCVVHGLSLDYYGIPTKERLCSRCIGRFPRRDILIYVKKRQNEHENLCAGLDKNIKKLQQCEKIILQEMKYLERYQTVLIKEGGNEMKTYLSEIKKEMFTFFQQVKSTLKDAEGQKDKITSIYQGRTVPESRFERIAENCLDICDQINAKTHEVFKRTITKIRKIQKDGYPTAPVIEEITLEHKLNQ